MPASPKLVQRITGALALLLFGTVALAAAVVGTDEREVAADAPSGTGFGPVLSGASLRPPILLTGFSGPIA